MGKVSEKLHDREDTICKQGKLINLRVETWVFIKSP